MKRLALFVAIACAGPSMAQQPEAGFSDLKALPSEINSSFEETAPFFDAATNTLYFTRTFHPDNTGGAAAGQDIWTSQSIGNGWGTPYNELPNLNNYLNNAVIGLSDKRLYLIGTYENKVSLQQGYSSSQATAEGWAKPIKLDVDGLVFKSDFYGGFVSQDGRVLLISAMGRGSLGEEDLYVSLNNGNSWSKPAWLGANVNSAGYETSPFLSDDGSTLYFASNGHGGLGDCDIFMCTRLDSSFTLWSDPVNLGSVVNSPQFDAFPFVSGQQIYFCSNRAGNSDLYQATNQNYYKPADDLRLAFYLNGKSVRGVRVQANDEAGNSLGTFQSTGEKLTIPGLKEHTRYTVNLNHPNVPTDQLRVYEFNSLGAPINAILTNGQFNYTAESKARKDARKPIALPQYVSGMDGIFELDGVPLRDVVLALTDPTGNTVQMAQTDERGRFEFANTADSAELQISVQSQLEYVRNNGVIYFTDDKGEKLFRSESLGGGNYSYQKLDEKEIAQLKILKELDDSKLEVSKGIYKYNNLPKEGVTLYLVDENDNIIEEVVTDADGKFEFKKLRPDLAYNIRAEAIDESELDAKGLVLFFDSEGNESDILSETGGGGYAYKPLRSELMSGLSLLQEEDDAVLRESFVFTVGLFKYNNLPSQGIKLQLLDENDQVIETVLTDANGQFVFSMLQPDKEFSVRIAESEQLSTEASQLFFVSNEGKVISADVSDDEKFAFNQLDPEYYFSINQLNEGETELRVVESFKDVTGKFVYQNLPKGGVKLYLLDENDRIIDTVYTDEEGNFVFSKLANEKSYVVRMAEEDASMLADAVFVMTDENNQELDQEVPAGGGFAFSTLPRSAGKLASLDAEDETSLDGSKFSSGDKPIIVEPIKQELKESETGEPMRHELALSTIYFHFNSVRLSARDRLQLNREIARKALRGQQPMVIVGYSCDLGPDSITDEVSRMRAEIIKEYLVSLGVNEHLIEISAAGNVLKEIEKPTTVQRVEARRAEVFFLEP